MVLPDIAVSMITAARTPRAATAEITRRGTSINASVMEGNVRFGRPASGMMRVSVLSCGFPQVAVVPVASDSARN
ncbi:hypothetical protein Mro03_44580 [Microbispora rosea subsp. rosea]|nr:hypothetical protein Mro03_44580 [Microbispora rosea subsp. rosea]